MTLIRVPELMVQPLLWRFVGFASCVVGLLCYALSSSFVQLFGKWNLLKIIIYSVISFTICSIMLFAKKWRLSKGLLLKAQLGFMVLMLTSFYSFYGKAVNASKPDVLSLISCASFAFMSLSLSRQTDLGFEVDLLNFFLGSVALQLMKINLILALVGAAFCYTLIVLRSSSNSQMEIGSGNMADHLAVDIDSANVADYSSHRNQLQSLSKRSDDGYEWIKYGQKQLERSENSRSYYKCTYPNYSSKKKVETSFDGKIREIIHTASHNHPEPQPTSTTSSSTSSLAIPLSNPMSAEIPDQSFAGHHSGQTDSGVTPDDSSGGDEFEEHETDATARWKRDGEDEGISTPGSRTVREPRVVVHTRSVVDVLDDGYRWWKYGQKVVKGNPNPRCYYKCRHVGCPVRKQIERRSSDPDIVMTTYEGKHNHASPVLLSR